MKLPQRRQFLHLAAGAAALPAMSRIVWAQTPPQSKAGTRLITLGTAAGPPPRAHRAQFSNLLIVNGSYHVVDAGDGTARRIAKPELMCGISEPFSSPIFTTTIRRG